MWAIPRGCAQDRVVLCTHGGGFVCGSMYSHRKMYAHLAKAIGCKALIVHYRRAPEYVHPAQVNDVVAAYKWLLDQGVQAKHICTSGDSAGGTLSTTVLLGLRNAGLPLPAAAMPISPWYDLQATSPSIKVNADKDVLVKEEVLKGMAAKFLGNVSTTDPLANILQADLTGLPPIYIQVGGDETLLDDSTRFEAVARAAGVAVKVDIFPGMQHVFQIMVGRASEADDAVRRMAQWVKPYLGL